MTPRRPIRQVLRISSLQPGRISAFQRIDGDHSPSGLGYDTGGRMRCLSACSRVFGCLLLATALALACRGDGTSAPADLAPAGEATRLSSTAVAASYTPELPVRAVSPTASS